MRARGRGPGVGCRRGVWGRTQLQRSRLDRGGPKKELLWHRWHVSLSEVARAGRVRQLVRNHLEHEQATVEAVALSGAFRYTRTVVVACEVEQGELPRVRRCLCIRAPLVVNVTPHIRSVPLEILRASCMHKRVEVFDGLLPIVDDDKNPMLRKFWNVDRHEHPVNGPALRVAGELLASLPQAPAFHFREVVHKSVVSPCQRLEHERAEDHNPWVSQPPPHQDEVEVDDRIVQIQGFFRYAGRCCLSGDARQFASCEGLAVVRLHQNLVSYGTVGNQHAFTNGACVALNDLNTAMRGNAVLNDNPIVRTRLPSTPAIACDLSSQPIAAR